MSLQIRTTVGNKIKFLDLFKDEPVLINLSFAELQDITKKNSAYSKQFSLPGSKKNNEIFNFFYDLNAIPTDFNPNNKFEAIMMWDGYEILQGYIRLNSVSIDKDDIIYSVTFYNQVGDLMANVGDKFLYDLDLNYLNHPYTQDVILYSQLDPTLFPLTGATNYSYQNGKTMWSLYNIGYNYTQSTSAYTQYFTTTSTTNVSIGAGAKTFTVGTNLPYQIGDYVKVYHDSTRFMFGNITAYNYKTGSMTINITSTEGSGSHNSWTITLENPQGAQIVDLQTTPLVQFTPVNFNDGTYNPIPPNFDFSGTPVHDYYFKPSIQIRELYTSIVNEAGYSIVSDFMDTDYFKHFYMPLKFVDETIYSRNAIPACYSFSNSILPLSYLTTLYVNPSNNVTCNSLGFSANTTQLQITSAYTGNYTFRFTFSVIPQGNCGSYQIPTVYFIFNDGVATQTIYQNNFCDGNITTVTVEQDFVISGNSYLEFYFYNDYAQISGFTSEISQGPRFIPEGSIINYDIEFPANDYKQIDFLTSINKYFNFVIVPSPEKPKELRIEPLIDYVGKGEILDWTGKIDFSQTQQVYPTSELINGTLEYEFKLDQDYANQDFKTQTNRIFGTDKFQLNQEYKDTTTKFDYVFSSPIDITISNAYIPLITIGSMSKLKTEDKSGRSQQTFTPFKILPKVIFRGPTLPNDNYGFVGGTGFTTPDIYCTSGITINVTDSGWIKYNDCFGNTNYEYVNTGSQSFSNCANASTFNVGFPYSDLATFSITSSGSSCNSQSLPAVYQYWYMNGSQVNRWQNLNRHTSYPFNYNNFSHYCNFRGEDRTNLTPSEFVFDAPDLYNIYYQDYVEDILNEENKIYSAKIYLYPDDIKQLKWNEKILINNTYFRINKITNFNLLEPSICDIELVKLTRDYEPHPKLYYEFLPCGTGSTLYSNSDLMYHAYSYANNYVKLYDDNLNYLGCYNVQIGVYDPLHNYQHYYFSDSYIPSLVNVYNDCGCSGRTQMDIVQEEPTTVRYFVYKGTECNGSTEYTFSSTSATLSATSVYSIYDSTYFVSKCVSGATQTFINPVSYAQVGTLSSCTECSCTRCYSYSYTATTSGLLEWVDCDGIVSDAYVTAGNTYTISCIGAREGTVTGDGTIVKGALCYDSCITPTPSPTSVTPTPTPTPSSTPITPTPTPTPTSTPTIYTCKNYVNYSYYGWIGDYQSCDGTWYYSVYIGPGGSVCAVEGTPYTINGDPLSPTFTCVV